MMILLSPNMIVSPNHIIGSSNISNKNEIVFIILFIRLMEVVVLINVVLMLLM